MAEGADWLVCLGVCRAVQRVVLAQLVTVVTVELLLLGRLLGEGRQGLGMCAWHGLNQGIPAVQLQDEIVDFGCELKCDMHCQPPK